MVLTLILMGVRCAHNETIPISERQRAVASIDIPQSWRTSTKFDELNLSLKWRAGTPDCRPGEEDVMQVHLASSDTVMIRGSKCHNYEAPFIHLLFGKRRVLLLDTGAMGAEPFPLRQVIDDLVSDFERREKVEVPLQLIVAHTHGHGDHVSGDEQFRGRPNTVVVGHSVEEVVKFFGFQDWPNTSVSLDLGDRVVDLIPTPGHEASSIAAYDRGYRNLYTGDTLYPGRLYISDFAAYKASVQRLVNFSKQYPVRYILGAHVEMSNEPGKDYPIGATYQPNEAPLELRLEDLANLNQILLHMQIPKLHRANHFIVSP
ncbi:MAG: MBL fold metallo-hydrolase [Bdellovibrionaceae bacterium]|nr:MBL fold metallo-hydrolase [Pseudobdellovibrionaceae bacterium]